MTTATTIRIRNAAESLAFIKRTALADCMTVEYDDGPDAPYVRRNWPRLSDGEELLWRVLAWINGGDNLPSLTTLRSGLDTENYAVVAETVRRVGA